MRTILIALGALLAWAALVSAVLHLLGIPDESRNIISLLLGMLAGVPLGLWAVNQEQSK